MPMPSARRDRWLALALLLAVLGLAYLLLVHPWFTQPLREIDADVAALREREQRVQAQLQQQPQIEQRLRATREALQQRPGFLREATAEAAAAALGAKLQDAVAMASPGNRSCTISNRTPLTDNRRDAEFVRVAMQVRLRCGVAELATVLHSLEATSRGVTARTEARATIRARHVVLAMGYANQRWIDQRVARNRSSYAFITDPIDADVLGPLQRTMVWESARPYLYLRATGEGRLLVGGLDDAIDIPARRDRRVEGKAKQLMKQLQHWFPQLDPTPAFSWAGTFAETADGLPFFGPHPQWGPRVHLAMAYGGNGITYSMIGAGLLRARIERRRHPLQDLFGFGRV